VCVAAASVTNVRGMRPRMNVWPAFWSMGVIRS
jgi:hypothetical protein